MIKKEYLLTRADGIKIYKQYSDEGRWLIQNETGIQFEEACDVETSTYTYSEGEIIVRAAEEEAEQSEATNEQLTEPEEIQ